MTPNNDRSSNNGHPNTAVVILNWNGRRLLGEYLPDVLLHTPLYQADIIVADNASTDDSIDYLKKNFPQVGIIRLEKNYGFAGGYNRAIAQLPHQYVVLLNSDVAPSVDWLTPLIMFMENHPKVAAVAPKIKDYRNPTHFEYAGAAGGFIDFLGYPYCRGRIMNILEKDNGQYDTEKSVFWASGAALMVRNRLYREAGGLDEDFFAHMEEIDLCWRLKNRGWLIYNIPASTVYHLGGGTLSQQSSHKTYLNFRNNLLMLLKNTQTPWWHTLIFFRMILDGVAAVHYLAKGEGRNVVAVLKAHIHFYKLAPRFMRKRTQQNQHVKVKHHVEIYHKSIIWSFFATKKHTYDQLSQ